MIHPAALYNRRQRHREGRDMGSRPAEQEPDAVVHAFPKPGGAPATMTDDFDARRQARHQARRQARKLANSSRQAAMLATPGELVELRRVIDAAADGAISLDDARAAVAELRRTQQTRRAA